jgi:energy-converting hydrogenase Eha subunit G
MRRYLFTVVIVALWVFGAGFFVANQLWAPLLILGASGVYLAIDARRRKMRPPC